MKTTSHSVLKPILIAVATLMALSSGPNLWAYDGSNQWDSRHHYRRDNYGYYDGPSYHHYILWHNHHGYWDTRGPVRVFINVD
jgi:hypothetical protein